MAALLAAACGGGVDEADAPGGFRATVIARTLHLTDLGVTDVDRDGRLDVFTLNHAARPLLLLNRGDGRFEDALVELGLSSVTAFPGAEPAVAPPAVEAPGLYLYWEGAAFTVRSHALASRGGAEIELFVPETTTLASAGDLAVEERSARPGRRLVIRSADAGSLVLRSTYFPFFTATVSLGSTAPELVFVGAERVSPRAPRFVLPPGADRHAMAWNDLDADGRPDVFVARGGRSGKLVPDPLRANDELLVFAGGRFEDRAAASGIRKEACPGRRAAWADADGDGWLDLYVGCGRDAEPRRRYPNQLHRQAEPQRFSAGADAAGLAIPEEGPFVWLDPDGDGDPDLLLATVRGFALHRNTAGRFTPEPIAPPRGRTVRLAVGDFDGDGRSDVFAAGRASLLLRGDGAAFEPVEPAALGLPARTKNAWWVDFDSDGRLDLHAVPDGLFRQEADGRFRRTGWLATSADEVGAYGAWLDADGDGRSDWLSARRLPDGTGADGDEAAGSEESRLTHWELVLHRNVGERGHWLQVDLVGAPGNRPALGAWVELVAGGVAQVRRVGEAEGSLRSQGHHRLYFGLGARDRAERLRVHWPDGSVQEQRDVAADRRLEIEQLRP